MLKLGGSVVTVKEEPMTPHHDNIKRLAAEISSAGPRDLVIVHGGGSYGHSVAKQYGIADGFSSQHQVVGFVKTHRAMVDLNTIILDALIGESIPAVSLAPSSFIVTADGRIGTVSYEVVKRLLNIGSVPVLYGDAVLDRTMGFCILSGDQLATGLALSLRADRLVFGVDIDGVYTSNPKIAPKARLVERLDLEKMRGMVEIGKALSTDVTGGMLGKIKEAAAAVESGIEVLIVNASKPGIILKALRGEAVRGTTLKR